MKDKGIIMLKKSIYNVRLWFARTYRSLFLIIIDILIVNFAAVLALVLRFDFQIPQNYYITFQKGLPWLIGIVVIVNMIFGLYNSLWKYVSVDEIVSVTVSSFISTFLGYCIITWMGIAFPRSFYIIFLILIIAFMGGVRFTYRFFRYFKKIFEFNNKGKKSRVLVIGAGQAGSMIIDELMNQEVKERIPVGIIDNDFSKRNKRIRGVPVVGTREDIKQIVEFQKIDEIIIAIPSAPKSDLKEIVRICTETKCKVKTVPGLFELIKGTVGIKQIRDVSIEDLLGRDPVKIDLDSVGKFISGKTVLVTGGGGSIGSELCRQVLKYDPKKLIIFDIYENNAYDIQNELNKECSEEQLVVLIGSVRDNSRLKEVFSEYRPNLIFHAAAHKHVPLMEDSPAEAIKNNVMGTYNVASAAHTFKAEKMVLISTDKAVNPTNVMGATKRLAERIVKAFDSISETEFVSVRFGNVLGSNGSVIPLFKKQIETGGPVTVTHPDIHRFFMTIPEAVQLVLQAGAMADGGEIFVLDMGVPVKIVTLAEELIVLSGFEPYKDIDIIFSGLRPGEKLYEELLLEEEGLENTKHKKIFIGKQVEEDFLSFELELIDLKERLDNCNKEYVLEALGRLVPTYVYTSNIEHRQKITEDNFDCVKDVLGLEIKRR